MSLSSDPLIIHADLIDRARAVCREVDELWVAHAALVAASRKAVDRARWLRAVEFWAPQPAGPEPAGPP